LLTPAGKPAAIYKTAPDLSGAGQAVAVGDRFVELDAGRLLVLRGGAEGLPG
jgi:hypothetical protein